jgi:hypothetical protein
MAYGGKKPIDSGFMAWAQKIQIEKENSAGQICRDVRYQRLVEEGERVDDEVKEGKNGEKSERSGDE